VITRTISDADLARMWEAPRRHRPEPGTYSSPVAIAIWDGAALTCTLTGRPIDPAAAIISPGLARAAQRMQSSPRPPVAEPAIAALAADYEAATVALQQDGAQSIAPADLFRGRLAACRSCPLWTETARQGRGRCESVQCGCSKRLLWLSSELCPAGRWPA